MNNMKNSLKILKKFGLAPVKKFKVESRTKKGKFYIVEVYFNGSLECNCVAGQFKRECYHKKKVKLWLQRQQLLNKLEMKAGISS